jgi:hypothetical protein
MDLNVTVNVQTGHPNAMQMMALIRGKTRNYFVYSDSGQVGVALSGYEQIIDDYVAHGALSIIYKDCVYCTR